MIPALEPLDPNRYRIEVSEMPPGWLARVFGDGWHWQVNRGLWSVAWGFARSREAGIRRAHRWVEEDRCRRGVEAERAAAAYHWDSNDDDRSN